MSGLGRGRAFASARLSRDGVEAQGTRARILETVRARPGIVVVSVARELGVHETTITYHLRVLVRGGFLVVRPARGRLHLYVRGAPESKGVEVAAALWSDVSRAIHAAMLKEPGVGVRELTRLTGVSRITTHYHVKRLIAAGLVSSQRVGRALRVFPTSAAPGESAEITA